LAYSPANLSVAEERYFRKFLSTEGYRSGDYIGIAYADYGDVVSVNQSFRIGFLFVNVTNFTQRLSQKGIQKFDIGIESLWNRDLEDVFAEVNFSRDASFVSFRTPPATLKGWEEGQLEGFVDTTNLEGDYDVDISLHYGEQTTITEGSVNIYRFSYAVIIIVSVVFILVAAGIIVLVIWIKKKKKGRK